jgi:hypothetical protein
LQSNVEHRIIGLQINNHLIGEIGKRYAVHSIANHRKIANSFKTESLLGIFDHALENVHQILILKRQNRNLTDIQEQLLEQTLQVITESLSFDFIGTMSPVSEVVSVQMPASWKSRVEDGTILDTFFELYTLSDNRRSSKVGYYSKN